MLGQLELAALQALSNASSGNQHFARVLTSCKIALAPLWIAIRKKWKKLAFLISDNCQLASIKVG
jgi:hypothetical protein